MEESEYKTRLEIIERNFDKEKNTLRTHYALSNAKFKIGDMISDSRCAFIVDKITVSLTSSGLPKPVYHGFELKKNLTPRKDKNRVCICGNDAELLAVINIKEI